jgi:hypothetical protein
VSAPSHFIAPAVGPSNSVLRPSLRLLLKDGWCSTPSLRHALCATPLVPLAPTHSCFRALHSQAPRVPRSLLDDRVHPLRAPVSVHPALPLPPFPCAAVPVLASCVHRCSAMLSLPRPHLVRSPHSSCTSCHSPTGCPLLCSSVLPSLAYTIIPFSSLPPARQGGTPASLLKPLGTFWVPISHSLLLLLLPLLLLLLLCGC